MANTTVGAEVQIEYSSIGEMRKALKDASDQLFILQQQFGTLSPQAKAAADKVKDLKDKIENANNSAQSLTSKNKFANFTRSLATVAQGFSAVQSGIALLGGSSENLQKSLLKVQSAMAFANAISDLGNLKEKFGELKDDAIMAFRAIKSAIGSTGIGLLVIAIAAIAANWDRIKGAITGVTSEQKKLNEQSAKNLETQKKKLDAIGKQEATLKLQGKSETDILNLKIAQTRQAIQAAVASVKNARITRDAQVAAAKRNRDILAGIINFLSAPLTLVLKTVGKIGEFLGKDWTFDLGQAIGNAIFDPAEVAKEGDAAISKAEEDLQVLANQLDGYKLQLRDINKKGNDKIEKDNAAHNAKVSEEDDSARKAALEAQKRAEQELERSRKNARGKELFDLELKYKEQKAIIDKGGADATALNEDYRNKQREINDKYDKLDEEAEKKKLERIAELLKSGQEEIAKTEEEIAIENLKETQKKRREEYVKEFGDTKALRLALAYTEATEEQKIRDEFRQKELKKDADKLLEKASDEELSFVDRLKAIKDREELAKQIVFKSREEENAFLETTSKKKKEILKAESQFRIDQAQKTADVLQGLSDVVGKETAAGKSLAIAAATINTYLAASKALTGIKSMNPLGAALAIAQAATVIAVGLKNVREIAKVKVPGGGSGGGNIPASTGGMPAPLQPTLSPAVQGQALNAQAINNLGNQSMRAYVLNSDIQNNSQRNAYLQRNARIG